MMKIINYFFALFLFCSTFDACSQVLAQQPDSLDSYTHNKKSDDIGYLSFGLSPTFQQPVTGNRIGLVYSMGFGANLSPISSLEYHTHFMGGTKVIRDNFQPSLLGVAAVLGNLQYSIKPFQEGLFAPLALGGGVSVMWQSGYGEISYITDDLLRMYMNSDSVRVVVNGIPKAIYEESWKIGFSLKAEYLVPFESFADVSFRLQWLPMISTPLISENNYPPASILIKPIQLPIKPPLLEHILSFGVFFRLNF